MKTEMLDIPVIQKSQIKKSEPVASACCAPKDNASVCCTPSTSEEDNDGACCAQPEDGSACCNK